MPFSDTFFLISDKFRTLRWNIAKANLSLQNLNYTAKTCFKIVFSYLKVLAHEGSWLRDTSQRHAAAGKSCVVHHIGDVFCARSVTLSVLLVFLLHVSATCHLRVKTQDFFAAACHWDISLRQDTSCARRLLALKELWRRDMPQRHSAGTKSCVFTQGWHVDMWWDTCSSDKVALRTHKHVPYVWITHDLLAAACRCDVSLRHNRSCARAFKG